MVGGHLRGRVHTTGRKGEEMQRDESLSVAKGREEVRGNITVAIAVGESFSFTVCITELFAITERVVLAFTNAESESKPGGSRA